MARKTNNTATHTARIGRKDLRAALSHALAHGTTRQGLKVKCRAHRIEKHGPQVKPMRRDHKIRIEEIKLEPGMRHKKETIVLVTLLVLGALSYACEHYLGINADITYAVCSATLSAPLANLLADV